jgi:hypothetical protein
MADPVTVTTEPSLAFEIERWMTELPRDLSVYAPPEASSLTEAVRSRVPVLTGTLAGSVTEVTEDGDFAIGMGEDVIYAGWIEFGGSRGREHIPEGRYVYPTLVEQVGRVQTVFEQATQMSINRFGWSE